MDIMQVEVYRIAEWRNGTVFRTELVKRIWIPMHKNPQEEIEIAKHHSGDRLAYTVNYQFNVKPINELGQETL